MMRNVDRNHAGEANDNDAEHEGWRLRSMSPKLKEEAVGGKADAMRILLVGSTLLSMAFAASPERVDLCRLVNEPSRFAGKVVEVQGYIKPLMHGTYLKQEGCDHSLFLVLPDEIPNYKGAVKVVRDAGFEAFEKARFNYQPDAPRHSAVFVGELEYVKRGKGFGYNKNHRVRLVLEAVR